jgi:hypothetical protein
VPGGGLLTEEGLDGEHAEAAVQEDLLLAGDCVCVLEVSLYLEVHHGELALVREESREDERFACLQLLKVNLVIILQYQTNKGAINGKSLINGLLDGILLRL